MKTLLVLASALLLLLSGCIGVPQEKYDALKTQCDQEKQGLQTIVDAQRARADGAEEKLSDCSTGKDADRLALKASEERVASLEKDLKVLEAAKKKAETAQQYRLALEYYNDAFGPGKVPNNYRLTRIETQVASLSDAALSLAWKSVRNCESSSECDSAKKDFTSKINAKVNSLALEIADIIGGAK